MRDETKKIIKTLKDSGLKEIFKKVESVFPEKSVYLVGGAIRNALMGLKVNDLDFSTSLKPKEVLDLLKGENLRTTGIEFGTVTWSLSGHEVEITTFRCDETYENHRHPEQLKFGESKLEDLERRDFTINAMMFSHAEGLYDPFQGAEDIESQIIKAVGDPEKRFNEDALRILRLFRFHLNYGFQIDEKTFKASKKHLSLIKSLSKERVILEVKKIFKVEVHLDKLLNLLKDLSSKEIKALHGRGLKNLNYYDQVFYVKNLNVNLEDYFFEKAYKKIYNLYSNLENARSLKEYQKLIVKFMHKNFLTERESKKLWINAKEFGQEFSKKIKEFRPRLLKKERVEELRQIYFGKELGIKLLEEEIKEYFLVDDFDFSGKD